jgi:threonine 3-dehydrogenase
MFTMQALQKVDAAPGLEVREVPPPERPGSGEVLIRVEATGICGTDVHIAEWTPGYEFMAAAMPVTLGHEFAGTVTEVGPDVGGFAKGSLVAIRPSVVCGRCPACKAGDVDACTNRRGIGVMRNGGFAPLVCVPAENCVPVPAGLDPAIAALTEPMTVSAEAVDTGEVQEGDRVLVLGPGTIGQGIALFAKAAGASEVVVAGHNDAPRLETLNRLGFDKTVDTAGRSLTEALAPYLEAGKFDVVIEATGVPAVVQPSLEVLRKRGILVICGIHPEPARVDLTRLVREHQQIRGAYRAPIATWSRVLSYLAGHTELVQAMISHRVPLSEALTGFGLARSKSASKVVVLPQA